MKRLSLLVIGVAAAAWARADGCDPARFLVAIDVGHYSAEPGAMSARGRPEFEFNLALAQQLHTSLADAGLRSLLINGNGTMASLTRRTAAARKAGAQLFVSIHHDSVQPRYLSQWTVEGQVRQFSDRFSGYSLFVSAENPAFEKSKRFAGLLGRQLREQGLVPTLHHAEPIPGENRPLLDPELGIYRFDRLAVLRTAAMPAVLFEAGVIVHRGEEEELSTAARRRKMVAAMTRAVEAYCAAVGSD